MANALGRAMSSASKKPIRVKPSDRGALHSALGVPQGQKIPAAKIAAAAKSSSPLLRKRADFAKAAASWN